LVLKTKPAGNELTFSSVPAGLHAGPGNAVGVGLVSAGVVGADVAADGLEATSDPPPPHAAAVADTTIRINPRIPLIDASSTAILSTSRSRRLHQNKAVPSMSRVQ
jgi:hypothetical protein